MKFIEKFIKNPFEKSIKMSLTRANSRQTEFSFIPLQSHQFLTFFYIWRSFSLFFSSEKTYF